MKASHMEQLRRMFAEEGLIEHFNQDADTAAAARDYVGSFEKAHGFVNVVDLVKAKRFGEAVARIAAQPSIWPLILRNGGAAVLNRVKSRLKG
jgi:hypothetical protein